MNLIPKEIYLFLNFEGVLHPLNSEEENEFSLLPLFEESIKQFHNLRIVVTSEWRIWYTLSELKSLFSPDVQDRVIGCTRDVSESAARFKQEEIQDYLRHFLPPGPIWIALDSSRNGYYKKCDQVIICDPTTGFSKETASVLIAILARLTKIITLDKTHYKRREVIQLITLDASAQSMAIKKIAEELLSRYDLSRYQFVGTIFIEEKKISYYRAYFEGSGYIVLGGGSFNDSDPLKIEKDVLEVYLHEQLHHFFEYHPSKVSFLTEIERMFPSESLPAHEKNSDLLGTYEHFAVCFLTVQALRRLNGMCPVVAGRRSNWLYTIIENKFSEIAELLRKHRMLVEDEIL